MGYKYTEIEWWFIANEEKAFKRLKLHWGMVKSLSRNLRALCSYIILFGNSIRYHRSINRDILQKDLALVGFTCLDVVHLENMFRKYEWNLVK